MAQDDTGYEDELSFYELEEQLMVSVASFIKTDLLKQPATVTVVTADQLRLSGARLLSEALMMYVPGIFVIEDQDDLITGFRGLAPDSNPKLMLLLNGTNMNIEWFWERRPILSIQ
ncbi:MAG: Plug domain-containing protein [Desulfobacteraceae bacterium]|nr:Plug domain-containing protein [Desulfobacteraceae bacterium]